MGQAHVNILDAYAQTQQSRILSFIGVLSVFNQGFHAAEARRVLSVDEGLVTSQQTDIP